ncbi:MAG TPA: protein kinase [Candidatus Sulfopaludibacter sp.]|nr:protein kinase [Candidatus Sulfopaludibacter sp.]
MIEKQHGRELRLSNKAFFRLSLLAAVLGVLCQIYAGVRISHYGGASKYTGWTPARSGDGWIVDRVDPRGPAAGKLQPGDRLVSIDGNGWIARTGPAWLLRDSPSRSSYRLVVSRHGTLLDQTMAWPVVQLPRLGGWLWIHLFSGVIYLATALLITLKQPGSIPGRRAVLSGVLACCFFTNVAMNPSGGLLSGIPLVLVMILSATRPFHILAGFHFMVAYPMGQPGSKRWRNFERLALVVCILIWIPNLFGSILRTLGPARAAAIYAAQYPWSLLYDPAADSMVALYAMVLGVANGMVCWSNYQAVPEGDLRRRLRWVSIGVVAGMIPMVVVAPLIVFGYASGHRAQMDTMVRLVNTFVVVMPLCIAYAIVKHRVMGIRVVLRAGLQYVLARNVLRFALACPAALIAFTVITHPRSSLADLAVGPAGKLNLILLALSALALKYRAALADRIDRRFFREAYRQDQIFLTLAEAIGRAADITEISRLLSSQIQAALHPRCIFAVSRDGHDSFQVVYSSSSMAGPRSLLDFQLPPDAFEPLESAVVTTGVSTWDIGLRAALDDLGIQLVSPIRGPNEGLIGLLLLGEKMSEEPYTGNDRRLLDTISAQTGVVWENLQLRQRLKDEQNIRKQVVARMDGEAVEMVMECPACGLCYDGGASACEADGRALTPSLPISRTIEGKYHLTRLIGRGGMGAVYQARDLRLDRVVAVKVTMGTLFGDASVLQRFVREARAAAKLDHPNVTRIFDFGELPGGGAFLVLEYLKGVTLRRELRQRGLFAPQESVSILLDVFLGVEMAHSRGIVHRDLKPENIFLVREGETKILDFGLAVVRDLSFSDREKLTRTGATVGTLAYMSREQFMGQNVDERTDVYALGIVALEMLTGELEAHGPAFTRVLQTLQDRLCAETNPPEHHQLAAVLRRALVDDRNQRYANVHDFRESLIPVLVRCPAIQKSAAAAAPADAASSFETAILPAPPTE